MTCTLKTKSLLIMIITFVNLYEFVVPFITLHLVVWYWAFNTVFVSKAITTCFICHDSFSFYVTMHIQHCYIQRLMLADMHVAKMYVSTIGHLLQIIYFRWCRENSQNYMLAHPNFNHSSMENYKREIFPTFMLALLLYVIHSLNWLYTEVIANIQCYIPTRKYRLTENVMPIKCPTFMWASLLNIYSFGTWCIYEWYRRHHMYNFTILYSTTTW